MTPKEIVTLLGLVLLVIVVVHAFTRHSKRAEDRETDWPPEDQH